MTPYLCMQCFIAIYVFYGCVGFFSSASIEGRFLAAFFR